MRVEIFSLTSNCVDAKRIGIPLKRSENLLAIFFGGTMPNYNAQVPPYAVFPGDVALAFNSEAPAAGQASQQFALPSYAGFPENGRTVRWQTLFGTAPSAISVVLQTALNDVDAQYATIDTSSATAGEARTVTGVRGNFLRAKVSSIAGGSGITVQVLG
jgi:hypothetical protein